MKDLSFSLALCRDNQIGFAPESSLPLVIVNLMIGIKRIYQEIQDFNGEIPYFYAGNWGGLAKSLKPGKVRNY